MSEILVTFSSDRFSKRWLLVARIFKLWEERRDQKAKRQFVHLDVELSKGHIRGRPYFICYFHAVLEYESVKELAACDE